MATIHLRDDYRCTACKHRFDGPGLSDFSYGEFVLWSTSGLHSAYFNALETPYFEEVERLCRAQARGDLAADELHRVLSEVLFDAAPDGTRFSMNGDPRCPSCGDTRPKNRSISPVGSSTVPYVTFENWARRDASSKAEVVRDAISRMRAAKV